MKERPPLSSNDRARVSGLIMAGQAARVLKALAVAVAAVLAFRHGLPGFILGGLLFGLACLARPGPESDLDRKLGPPP